MAKIEKVIFIHQEDEIEITIEEHENQNLDICAEVDWYSLKSTVQLNAVLGEVQRIHNNLKHHFNNLGPLIEIECEGAEEVIKIADMQTAFPNTPVKRI
ncbi:hypothetical protein [Acinetobacter sp. ANC 4641]|uniref:hypothetical protein n=1 Tax=Acinetobacter sp. ANC 4641 TaxID=2529847 RepID=UPI00103D5A15|nr:hypothetical protein [Acinetobacter sp. ANC 4641]TCB12684.1 hypothetical protein E0H78_05735 [Acinetobacter sp. ANC 4641]